jgi:hypothetical protein
MTAVSLQPVEAYPDARGHRRRWRELARSIASDTPAVDAVPAQPATPGELVIVGSGIEAAGFTAADELRIDDAEYVFYCVADPATKVWINSMRPDAYDLYVLYDDSKRRYSTYVQMSEALLHYVRRGARVVAIFYGHPGIFVLATHRALRIARREGHRAEMRAAVSALDTLCADLGVDPSQPGMAMYEATEMLIRRRRPDTGLHLVLWQVGLIGELGYRRAGFVNANVSVLLDYLEELYGDPGHPVVNYVGSRYPGVDPLIDEQTIASLRDPNAQNWVTGISTFYLPPQQAAAPDPVMLERLGLIQPGDPVRGQSAPLRVIDAYGSRERRAIGDLARFDVPATYEWQPDTEPARFILALRSDSGLRDRYHSDPAATVAAWAGPLSDRERRMLAQRDPGAMQLAAKHVGTSDRLAQHRRLFARLYGRRTLTYSLCRAVDRRGSVTAHDAAERWSRSLGYDIDWDTFPADAERLRRNQLHPWTGLYLADERRSTLSIHAHPGRPASDQIELDGERLREVTFAAGRLSWTAAAGNPCSGYVQADEPRNGVRRFVGVVWPDGALPGSQHKFVAIEHRSRPAAPLASMVGSYRAVLGGVEQVVAVELDVGVDSCRRIVVSVDGRPCDGPVTVRGRRLQIGDLRVPSTGRIDDGRAPAHLRGQYRARVHGSGETKLLTIAFGRGAVAIDGHEVERVTWQKDTVHWDGGPPDLATGQLVGLLDPITLHPMIHGSARSTAGTSVVLRGMIPVTPGQADALTERPGDGLPAWAWRHVIDSIARASDEGGCYLWHGWERTRVNAQRIHHVLDAVREDDGR